jgi:hypothetical protein
MRTGAILQEKGKGDFAGDIRYIVSQGMTRKKRK